ncbi:MAG: ankyrin repeat domain-containing protein [Planctomycetota bacterium]
MSDKPAPLDPELVQEFVGKAHGDLDRVQELLKQHPTLLNAAWDWGGGDWETALGAAAHMGRRDIADYLIEQGARIDIFAAAMLGWADVVKAMLSAQPTAQEAPGPHGISLRAHAEAGGDGAAAVIDLLDAMGVA